VLLKRGASSAWALHCSVRERLRLLDDEEEPPGQPPLPFDDPGETDDDDSTMPSVLREPGLEERGRELQILAELRETAYAAAAGESKLARVATLLRRTRESAIVFTEYVDTLDAATRALSAFGPIAMLHGGLSRLDRREAEHAFTAGRARVLLATDVASEGLNLHGCCRLVINLELPWNPVRLEQRIGRVDRIGQARRVHAVLVVGEDTAESYVLERLATRVRNIRRSLGDAYGGTPVSDTLLAGGALGEETTHDPPVSAEAAAFRPWSPAEREAHDICALLHWARRTAAGADPGSDRRTRGERLPLAAVRPRVRARLGLAQGVLLGFRVEATSGNARTAAAAVVMVHVALAAPALSAARPATLVSGVLPLAQAAAARAGAESMVVEIDAHHRYVARASTREAALLSAATPVDADVPSPLVQPGLFDRRALHEAARQEAAREHRRGLHAARLSQLALEQGLEPEVCAEPILAMVLQ
jgi:hypothetical protein